MESSLEVGITPSQPGSRSSNILVSGVMVREVDREGVMVEGEEGGRLMCGL